MDLNEAIAHARETAEGKNPNVDRCSECAAQHAQLAEWLEELREYKATDLTPEQVEVLKVHAHPYIVPDREKFFEDTGIKVDEHSLIFPADERSEWGEGFFLIPRDGYKTPISCVGSHLLYETMLHGGNSYIDMPKEIGGGGEEESEYKANHREVLVFSERRKLANAFADWAERNGVAHTPEGIIAYLLNEGLLNVRECRYLITEKEEKA